MALRLYFVPFHLKNIESTDSFRKFNDRKSEFLFNFEEQRNKEEWILTKDKIDEPILLDYYDNVLWPMVHLMAFHQGHPYRFEEKEEYKFQLDRLQILSIIPTEFTHSFAKDLLKSDIESAIKKIDQYSDFIQKNEDFLYYLKLRAKDENNIARSCWPFDDNSKIRFFLSEDFFRLKNSINNFDYLHSLLNAEELKIIETLKKEIEQLSHHQLLQSQQPLVFPFLESIEDIQQCHFEIYKSLYPIYMDFHNTYAELSGTFNRLYRDKLNPKEQIEYEKKYQIKSRYADSSDFDKECFLEDASKECSDFINYLKRAIVENYNLHLAYFDIPFYEEQ